MTIPVLTTDELIELLRQHDWNVVNNDFWNTHNRIIVEKNGVTFPLQFKEKYFFPFVVVLCQSLEIEPPKEHLKCFEQIQAMKKNNK